MRRYPLCNLESCNALAASSTQNLEEWDSNVKKTLEFKPTVMLQSLLETPLTTNKTFLLLQDPQLLSPILAQFLVLSRDSLVELDKKQCEAVLNKALSLPNKQVLADLFLQLSMQYQENFIVEMNNSKVSELSALQKAIAVSLVEYPLAWDNSLALFSEELKDYAMSQSSNFMNIQQAFLQNPYLTKVLGWEDFKYFIVNYHKETTSEVKKAISNLFSLRSDSWKLFIDPPYQKKGPMGLYNGICELGFLNSMQSAMLFSCFGINKGLSPFSDPTLLRTNLFAALHAISMGHKKNYARFDLRYAIDLWLALSCNSLLLFLQDGAATLEEIRETTFALEFIPGLNGIYEKRVAAQDMYVNLYFNRCSKDELMKHLIRGFNDYQKALEAAKTPEDKKIAIAAFHQYLERTHLFKDGNSRLDILMLQIERVLNGFMPTIVDPNGSYILSMRQWASIIEDNACRNMSNELKVH